MAVISIANAKGGAGKTTAAALLATEFVRLGYSTALFDCDQLQFSTRWVRDARFDKILEPVGGTTVANLANNLRKYRGSFQHTIIDLSGASDVLIALAAGLSDLVIVPVQGSAFDGYGAMHVLGIIEHVVQNAHSQVKRSVVLSRVNPMVTTRALKDVAAMLALKDIFLIPTPIIERSAYRDMFGKNRTLYSLEDKQTSNLEKARANMQAFAADVLATVSQKTEMASVPPFSALCFHEHLENAAVSF